MKAPTPVSAYLHSATMVKAGVYLIARFTPVLGQHVYWNTTLMIVGGITMLYTAFHAIFRTDLKSILAYSTIAALGMLIFLLGIGTHQALIAVAVFILVHALYKAALFLVAGVIDHEAGTRDVTVLKGLRHVILPVAIAGVFAALSNAGIPFTFGFLGKDLIYEATLNYNGIAAWLTVLVVITNILLLYSGFVAGIKPFTGKLPSELKVLHLPTALMWFPPLLLGVIGFIIGSFPGLVDKTIVQPVVLSMYGGAVYIPLKIWHGFNLVLLLSFVTISVGLLLYWLKKPSHQQLKLVSSFENASPQHLFFVFKNWIKQFSSWYTRTLLNGYLRYYIMVILIFLMSIVSFKLFTGVNIYVDSSDFNELTIYEILITIIMFCAIILVCVTPSRLAAVASMGVVGYCLCLFFVFYSAPDLAMTQFAIDTLTVVLFVLVLFKLPPFINYASKAVRLRDALIGLLFGTLITIVALEVLNESVQKEISHFYGDNAYSLAKGKNVVNVILVDFRGFDTMVEITVLAIAAIGVFSLIKFKITKDETPSI
jgi:multicomponent Na+:H+ antiporter subunit A